jgi:very-short-patch-repair endonuclease
MSLKQAKTLRSNMTDAERRLWYRLRAHRFAGVKFKRQVPIGPYVVDFACMGRKLVLEIDGGQHAENSMDRVRDEWLGQQGYVVLRFWNTDVLRSTDAVLERILTSLQTCGGNPSPGAQANSGLPEFAQSLRLPKSETSDFGCAPPSPLRGEGKKTPGG